MFSDWIIIVALVVLVAVVILYFKTGIADGPVSPGTAGSSGESRSKNKATGN